jgi:ribonuclease HI
MDMPAPLGPTPTVQLYCDGACSGNPGRGGWAYLLKAGAHEKTASGHAPHTTNNQMELTAAIEGLRGLSKPTTVQVFTDSQYVVKGMTEWRHGWAKKGWKNSQNQAVANLELWQALIAAAAPHRASWHWVRGHAGHTENERVDALAVAARDTHR